MTYRFKPNLKILVLSVVLLPILISLGYWQLDRAEEKKQILAALESRSNLAPVPVEQLLGQDDIRYRTVHVSGSFDNRHSFLLDNRVRNGRPGYEVITPLYTDGGHWLLINRGWIEAPLYRHELPEVPPVSGPVQVTGVVHTPLEKASTVYDAQQGWPKVIQSLEFNKMGNDLGHSPAPFTVRLREGETASLQVGWSAINVQPHKHTAYAVQWFAMALALVILTGLTSFKRQRK